jgi:hypothetical protein
MIVVVWFSWCSLIAGVAIDILFLARGLFQVAFGRKVTSGLPILSLVLYLAFVAARRPVGLPAYWAVVLGAVLFHLLVQFVIIPFLYARASVERSMR